MNLALLLVLSLAIFWVGYKFYARYICTVYDEDDQRPTPAVAMEDGVDYIPTRPAVVFGHHFASIAGAGPILGPAIALVYGWWPCLLWILFGTVLIGSVHDLAALLTSIREKGKSVAEMARDAMGSAGFFLIIAFTLVIVLLVCAAFLNATATALTSMYPLTDMGLGEGQHVFRTVDKDGTIMAVVGGIASSQVIGITALAPLVGWLLYKKKANMTGIVLLSIAVIIACLFIGIFFPLQLSPNAWKIAFCIYTFFAAGIPVWIFLQPRDFINSFILYAGIIILVIGTFAAGFRGIEMQMPAVNLADGTAQQGPVYPMLFILIACGAISGFHALVAGGTSSKQVSRETDCRRIGYGAMLLEGVLAVVVIIAITVGLDTEGYMRIVYPAKESGLTQNPILAFAVGMGSIMNKSIGLPFHYGTIFGVVMVEGFIATTLDTAVRLNRYLFEELWSVLVPKTPAFLKSYLFNAGLAVVIMYFLAKSNALKEIWPIFGAGNQLLAALTLLVISVWLLQRKKPAWFTILPGIFMLVTTISALIWMLVYNYMPKGLTALIIADWLLLLLSAGAVFVAGRSLLAARGAKPMIDPS